MLSRATNEEEAKDPRRPSRENKRRAENEEVEATRNGSVMTRSSIGTASKVGTEYMERAVRTLWNKYRGMRKRRKRRKRQKCQTALGLEGDRGTSSRESLGRKLIEILMPPSLSPPLSRSFLLLRLSDRSSNLSLLMSELVRGRVSILPCLRATSFFESASIFPPASFRKHLINYIIWSDGMQYARGIWQKDEQRIRRLAHSIIAHLSPPISRFTCQSMALPSRVAQL